MDNNSAIRYVSASTLRATGWFYKKTHIMSNKIPDCAENHAPGGHPIRTNDKAQPILLKHLNKGSTVQHDILMYMDEGKHHTKGPNLLHFSWTDMSYIPKLLDRSWSHRYQDQNLHFCGPWHPKRLRSRKMFPATLLQYLHYKHM